ncbi:hypothetical protein PENTCL1PPCAC_24764, partial [Pristionchus entomophagus]
MTRATRIQDAHRALEQIEDFHEQLNDPRDAEFQRSIESLIKCFKDNLFSALLELQDLYDYTLLSSSKGQSDKIREVRRLLDSWQSRPPIGSRANLHHGGGQNGVEKIVLYKITGGLGFSVAGGVGNEHVPGDNGIYITKIIDDSAAAHDGRLEVGDRLFAVDETLLDNVSHDYAVNVLKNTGSRVQLQYVKNPHPEINFGEISTHARPRSVLGYGERSFGSSHHIAYPSHETPVYQPDHIEIPLYPRKIELFKGSQGLGINIVGGEEAKPIFIANVLPGGVADMSGDVMKGDVLLEVNGVSLRSATHVQAAECLKQATNPVTLGLQYRPQEYEEFEQKLERLGADRTRISTPPAVAPQHLYVK